MKKFNLFASLLLILSTTQAVAQSQQLTPKQKAAAAQVIASEYRMQRAWGAAIYHIEQPMNDIANLVALLKLCKHEQARFGNEFDGGEWHKLTGSECPVKYERRLTWKGVQHEGYIANEVVDDDTVYSTTDSRVLAELNISSLKASWDIRLKSPSPYNRSFEVELLDLGRVKAKTSSASELINPDTKKLSSFNVITLPEVVVEASSFTWIFRNEPTKKFTEYLLNGQKIKKSDFDRFRL